jgi:uncharacterized membrane protein YphA (DoxX/SURF4 family)
MSSWQRYWFAPAPCFDLAIMRVVAVAMQLFWMVVWAQQLGVLEQRAALPADLWNPLPIFKFLNLPWGWGFRPEFETLQIVYYICLVAGVLALIGLLTNATMAVFAVTCVYLQAFLYSFNDFHHTDAVMMVALSILAISPSGRVLSVDAWLRSLRGGRRGDSVLTQTSEFAAWPIKLIQWFFVLMYASAVWSKLGAGGLDWANGFTLQYYLAREGLRWESPLALWLSHHHIPILLAQYGVLLFQATFALPVIFPKLRWIYVPAGLCLHTGIFLTLKAPFFTWMALYTVFIPWTEVLRLLQARFRQMVQPATTAG